LAAEVMRYWILEELNFFKQRKFSKIKNSYSRLGSGTPNRRESKRFLGPVFSFKLDSVAGERNI
jgi:hypothetical protein